MSVPRREENCQCGLRGARSGVASPEEPADDAHALERIGFYVVVLLIGALLLGLRIYLRSRTLPSHPVRVSAISELFKRIQERAREHAYIALVPPPGAGARVTTLNLQFSIVNGRVGFDWIVTDGDSTEKEPEFSALARSLGHTVREHSVSGVRALRVEDGDLVALCRRVLRDIAHVPDDGEIQFTQKGLARPQS